MTIDGYNVSSLFETQQAFISFAEDPRKHIPIKGSIIYTVWDEADTFIYVGISGLQKSVEKRNPQSRMVSHASGRRSGDQFCVYIHDYFVIPELIKNGRFEAGRGVLDKLTKNYIQSNLKYRFLAFKSDDSDVIVRSLERRIQAGACGVKPYLNGT